MTSWLSRLYAWYSVGAWSQDLANCSAPKAIALRLLRNVLLTIHRHEEHRLTLRAQALTYVTVLSLVPLLAFAFAVAKGLGFYDKLVREVVMPFVNNNFGSLASSGAELAEPTGSVLGGNGNQLRVAIDYVLQLVQDTDVAGLGLVGLLLLAWTAIGLLSQVERAFNAIWGVQRQRIFLRRVTDYLAMMVVAPLLALVATAFKASAQSQASIEWVRGHLPLGPLLDLIFALGPLVTMWIVFTLLYLVMPNTRVRLFSALIGGIVAAGGWSLVQEIYVKAQIGVSSYSQVYATFAAIPLFLFWVYLSWMCVFIGAEFGHADQDQQSFRRHALSRSGSQSFFETAILSGLGRIAERFEGQGAPLRLSELIVILDIPQHILQSGLGRLEAAGIVVPAGDDSDQAYVLARGPDRIRIADALVALRGSVPSQVVPREAAVDRRVRLGAAELEQSLKRSDLNLDLRSLIGETKQG